MFTFAFLFFAQIRAGEGVYIRYNVVKNDICNYLTLMVNYIHNWRTMSSLETYRKGEMIDEQENH